MTREEYDQLYELKKARVIDEFCGSDFYAKKPLELPPEWWRRMDERGYIVREPNNNTECWFSLVATKETYKLSLPALEKEIEQSKCRHEYFHRYLKPKMIGFMMPQKDYLEEEILGLAHAWGYGCFF